MTHIEQQRQYIQSLLFQEVQQRQRLGACRLLDLCEYIRDHVDPLDYKTFDTSIAVSAIIDEYLAWMECKQAAN